MSSSSAASVSKSAASEFNSVPNRSRPGGSAAARAVIRSTPTGHGKRLWAILMFALWLDQAGSGHIRAREVA